MFGMQQAVYRVLAVFYFLSAQAVPPHSAFALTKDGVGECQTFRGQC